MALVNSAETGPSLTEPPVRPDGPAIPTKAKHQDIRVSPAVLDAAGKNGEELLQSLRTTAAGPAQTEAEERARTRLPRKKWI